MKITVKSIAHHRNGIYGEPFHVVLFRCGDSQNMVATVFAEKNTVAVLDVDLLARGEIRFAYNSWRGDVYESDLRKAIDKWDKAQWSQLERKREIAK